MADRWRVDTKKARQNELPGQRSAAQNFHKLRALRCITGLVLMLAAAMWIVLSVWFFIIVYCF